MEFSLPNPQAHPGATLFDKGICLSVLQLLAPQLCSKLCWPNGLAEEAVAEIKENCP